MNQQSSKLLPLGTYEKRCAFLQDVVNVEDLFSKVTK